MDPSVMMMRKVFKDMESAQSKLLQECGISQYDFRIREWREKALAAFEKAWEEAPRMGIEMNDQTAPVVYMSCLRRIMGLNGIKVNKDIIPEYKGMEKLLEGIFR